MYLILAINPGSTSTKIGLFEDEKPIFKETLRHSVGAVSVDLDREKQAHFRREAVLGFLNENDLSLSGLSAIVVRGGLLKPLASGTYLVDEDVYEDLVTAKFGWHASNLGTIIALPLARELGIPVYTVDPVTVDEFETAARYSGLAGVPRLSMSHALNMKAMARRAAALAEKKYDQLIMKKEEAKSQLLLVSNRLYDLQMTIGSSKEDFKFFEKAQEPIYPKPSYKKVIVIMLGVLGAILAIAFILVKEFLNNTVKTKFDLSERFGIKELVQLPIDKTYSSKIKHSFSYLANSLISSMQSSSSIITVGSDIPKANNPNVISLLLEQLNQRETKTLHIEVTSEIDADEENKKCMSIEELLLNASHINDNIDKAYWCIKEDYSIYTPNIEEISSLMHELKNLHYDYIIIQVPAYTEAEHLIPVVIELSDAFISTTKFEVSSRKVINKLMKRIEHIDFKKIKGVINEAHKHFTY